MSKIQLLISIVIATQLLNGTAYSQDACSPDSVIEVSGFENLYRFGEIYIGGQPDQAMIDWLQAAGVMQVVNLRTSKENEEFAEENFDEKVYIESKGMVYTSVPVGGGKEDPHPDKLGEVSDILNSGDKVLLHCKTGGRARYFLMVYLINEKDCPKRNAKKVIREMGYVFPLELLLGNQIKVDEEDS